MLCLDLHAVIPLASSMVSSPACSLPIPKLHSRQFFEVATELLNVTVERKRREPEICTKRDRKETKGFNCFLCNPAMNSFRAAIKRTHRCNLNILQLPLKYLHFNTLEIKLHSKRSVLWILFSNITGSFICKYITGFCQF